MQSIGSAEIIIATKGGLTAVEPEAYPDGMPLVRLDQHTEPFKMLLRPKSVGSFMTAMFLVDALRERRLVAPSLFLPWLPGARQDRLNPTGDYLFTVKSIAAEINAREFPSVELLDPHSDVGAALIHRSRVITAADCINPPAGKYAAVVASDGGAEKRAGAVARKLGVPLLHAWKSRDVATGNISGFGLEPGGLARGSLVLVVDDICDGGGTFIGLADALDATGLRAHLWVTHGLFTKGTAPLLERYGHVYCTDSVPGDRPGVIEIDFCNQLFSKGVFR